MKKKLLILFLGVLCTLPSLAIPNICKWDNKWDTEMPSYVVNPSGNCTFTWKMTSTNKCWGTRHYTYTWTAPCVWYANTLPPGYVDPNDNENTAAGMAEIKITVPSVPDLYCDAQNFNNNPSVLDDAIRYRLMLAGYENVDLWPTDDPCFIPETTLPVIVPLNSGAFQLDVNCISVSPVPAINTLNINFGSQNLVTSKFQLIETLTGAVWYQKIGGIVSNETVPIATLPRGYYQLVFFDNLGVTQFKTIQLVSSGE